MLLDLSPLQSNRDFRLLFAGQVISLLGSMMTYVAIPYQVFELTHSSWQVGMIGVAQLVPVLVLGLVGGSFADAFDRRRLLIVCESLMAVAALGLTVNASMGTPRVWVIFALAALLQAANSFHRPAMDALVQKLVEPEHFVSIGALGSLRFSVGAILGPALGGALMAWGGARVTYSIDACTFLFAAWMAFLIKAPPLVDVTGDGSHLNRIAEGLRYATGRPELIGTYLVDMVAMTFAFPIALFPEMSQKWGGAPAAGALFAAMPVGALLVTVFSGWTHVVRRRGAAVVLAAAVWGLGIIGLGLSPNLLSAVLFLALAGGADMISGLFRGVIWNETIPNEMRGRMAGVEMISYMSGPLLGNARAGWMASLSSVGTSLVMGGILCTVGVTLCGLWLREFWRYDAQHPPTEPQVPGVNPPHQPPAPPLEGSRPE